MMKTYSSLVFKTALIWTFIAVVIFLAQIFNEIILDQEMKMILWLQKELDVKSENVMLKGLNMLATFEGQQVFFYLWTLVLFYAVNSYIATKQFYVYFVANLFLIILQIFYQMPRPFWVNIFIYLYNRKARKQQHRFAIIHIVLLHLWSSTICFTLFT